MEYAGMKITILKNMFVPSRPWYILVNGQHINSGGFRTKKAAMRCLQDACGVTSEMLNRSIEVIKA